MRWINNKRSMNLVLCNLHIILHPHSSSLLKNAGLTLTNVPPTLPHQYSRELLFFEAKARFPRSSGRPWYFLAVRSFLNNMCFSNCIFGNHIHSNVRLSNISPYSHSYISTIFYFNFLKILSNIFTFTF